MADAPETEPELFTVTVELTPEEALCLVQDTPHYTPGRKVAARLWQECLDASQEECHEVGSQPAPEPEPEPVPPVEPAAPPEVSAAKAGTEKKDKPPKKVKPQA